MFGSFAYGAVSYASRLLEIFKKHTITIVSSEQQHNITIITDEE